LCHAPALVCTYTRTLLRAHCSHIHTDTHKAHTHIHTYTCTLTHMQMRTHAYKHTCVQGEEGIDAGGVSREWYAVMAQEIFNPNLALFVQVCVCVCVCAIKAVAVCTSCIYVSRSLPRPAVGHSLLASCILQSRALIECSVCGTFLQEALLACARMSACVSVCVCACVCACVQVHVQCVQLLS